MICTMCCTYNGSLALLALTPKPGHNPNPNSNSALMPQLEYATPKWQD